MVMNCKRVLLLQTSYLKKLSVKPFRSAHVLKLKTPNPVQSKFKWIT